MTPRMFICTDYARRVLISVKQVSISYPGLLRVMSKGDSVIDMIV
jgi:hypothetical protein